MFQSGSNSDHCRFETISHFHKGETILALGDHTGRCGLLLSGQAHLSSVSEGGQDTTLEILTAGDSFGENYMSGLLRESCYVTADTECKVRFINMKKLIAGCGENCIHHQEMLRVQLMLAERQSQSQSFHLHVLSQRSLREKLMVYLLYQQQYASPGASFTIPMSLVALANYLSVDRSAMMREIRNMNDAGLIHSSGSTFTIL